VKFHIISYKIFIPPHKPVGTPNMILSAMQGIRYFFLLVICYFTVESRDQRAISNLAPSPNVISAQGAESGRKEFSWANWSNGSLEVIKLHDHQVQKLYTDDHLDLETTRDHYMIFGAPGTRSKTTKLQISLY
jgi:hypothetical protein